MIAFSFKVPKLSEKVRRYKSEINLYIAAQMQANRGQLFARGGAFNGHQAWLKPMLRAGQPLKDSGALSQSLGPRMGKAARNPVRAQGSVVKIYGNVVSIGTTLHYAEMMNWGTTKLPGGVLKPKNKPLLWIPIPSGKGASDTAKGMHKNGGGNIVKYMGKTFLLAKQVRIPARRFDNWTPQDRKDLNVALARKLAEVLNR